ncbi:MAG: hypothetical protein JXR48_00500 [Candidatus Delongbacteria bacterium]|nr:hypothetical protein [Candidatus Delongbacteria bacterium]MBN2833421.1 hypothetical protein [Candidatus Delongbacteria bacterium]
MKKICSFKDLVDYYNRNLVLTESNTNRYNNINYFKPLIISVPEQFGSSSAVSEELVKTLGFNTNYFVSYNFFKSESPYFLLRNFIYNVLDISSLDKDEEILRKIELLENDKFPKHRIILILELLGILKSEKTSSYNYKHRTKLIIREFAHFINFIHKNIFEKNALPLVFDIRNCQNLTQDTIKLFFSSLHRSLFKYPFIVIITGDLNDFVIRNKKFNIALLDDSDPFNLILEINNKYNVGEYFLNKYDRVLDQNLIYNLNIRSSEPEKNLFDQVFESLDYNSNTFLKYLSFFDGAIFLSALKHIPIKECNSHSSAISGLYKRGFVKFSNNQIVLKDLSILTLVKKKFDDLELLETNLESLVNILEASFESGNRRYFEYYRRFHNKIFGENDSDDFKSQMMKYESDGESLLICKLMDKFYDNLTPSESEENYFKFLYYNAMIDLEKYTDLQVTLSEAMKFNAKENERILNFYFLGKAFLFQGDRENSLENLQNGLILSKEAEEELWSARIHDSLGDYYMKYADFENAKFHFQESQYLYKRLSYNKEIVQIYYKLGKLYFNNNDLKKSMDTLNLGLLYYQKTTETSSEFFYGKINYLCAVVSFSERAFEKASVYFMKALEIFNLYMDYEYLGKCYFRLSDLYIDRDIEKAADYMRQSLIYTSSSNSIENLIEIYHILIKFYRLKNDIGSSKKIAKKAMQICSLKRNHEHFARFVEEIGDIYYCESRHLIAKKCYKFAFKRYTELGMKIQIPSILLKMATLYAETGKHQNSNKILSRLDQPDYEYYLNYDNQFNYNNIAIENLINERSFDNIGVFLDRQESFLSKDGITLKNKIGFFRIKAVYLMMTGDIDNGRAYHQKALELCKNEGLLLEEIRVQFKIVSILSTLNIKKSALKHLVQLTEIVKKVNSVYLDKYVLRMIYRL